MALLILAAFFLFINLMSALGWVADSRDLARPGFFGAPREPR